jgi:preprotein translocase subunit SecB
VSIDSIAGPLPPARLKQRRKPMSDTTTNPPTTPPNGAVATPPKVTQRILAQYIRDMSFENMLARKGLTGDLQPEIAIQVNLDGRKRGADKNYEVITKLSITNKSKNSGDVLFLLEIEYAGLFFIDGIPDEQLHPYLLIECPRITFPFLRRIVSDITRDGGFPPLNLEMIDFVALYRNELARRAQAKLTETAPPAPRLDS